MFTLSTVSAPLYRKRNGKLVLHQIEEVTRIEKTVCLSRKVGGVLNSGTVNLSHWKEIHASITSRNMKEIMQLMIALFAMVTQVESLNCSESLQVECMSNQTACREIKSDTKDQVYDGYTICSSDPEAEFCVQITASVQSRPGLTKPLTAQIIEAKCSTKKSIQPDCITRKDLPDESSKIAQIIKNATLSLEGVKVCYSKGGFGTQVSVFVMIPPLLLILQYLSITFTEDEWTKQ